MNSNRFPDKNTGIKSGLGAPLSTERTGHPVADQRQNIDFNHLFTPYMTAPDEDRHDDSALCEQFVRLFTRDQLRVMAYIRSLIPDHTAANDVFQETSLVLWHSFASFRPDSEFAPWAMGVARHQMLKYWRSQRRDRLVFSEFLLNELSGAAIDLAGEMDSRQQALDECVKRLTDRQRDLIHRFYGENLSAGSIAQVWDRSVHSVYKALKVMRRSLLECVEYKLAAEKK